MRHAVRPRQLLALAAAAVGGAGGACGAAPGSSSPPARAQETPRPAKPSAAFSERKAKLLSAAQSRVAFAAPLSPPETVLEARVLRLLAARAAIDPAKSFLEGKAAYDASELLAFLRRMPKGAVLHTHGIATVDFNRLVDLLQGNDHWFVWQGGDAELEGKVQAFGSKSAPKGWVKASSMPREKLYAYLTLAPGLPSVEACWEAFGKLWGRVENISQVADIYYGRDGLLWDMLWRFAEDNVAYVEIKEHTWIIGEFYRYDGHMLSDDEWISAFQATVDEFRRDRPEFLGARMVLTSLKNRSVAQVRADYKRAVRLAAQYPASIAGFDLAGPEDLLTPIAAYADMFTEERAAAAAIGVRVPLFLHAGETNVPGAQQILDAVALGCERVGHGFALARFPTAIDDVIASGASLECCPISNQVLGYVPNLAAHQGLTLLRAGVPMHLSPDDPGMWHYTDVSYDFAAVVKAWDLGLTEIKALCRSSLACSSLGDTERKAALAAWEAHWDAWIQAELATALPVQS